MIEIHTNLLWLYRACVLYLRLTEESLKVAKLRPEPKYDMPFMPPEEPVFTIRDFVPGTEALRSAGRSSFVK